jgi:hypothetical protein
MFCEGEWGRVKPKRRKVSKRRLKILHIDNMGLKELAQKVGSGKGNGFGEGVLGGKGEKKRINL